MADFSAMIAEKNAHDEERQKLNQAERANLSAMRDAALTEITSDPEQFSLYLDLQAANIRCSSGNVALAMVQLKDRSPTLIGSADFWRSVDRSVAATELQQGAKVFIRPKNARYRGYLMGQYYDVSQTVGKPVAGLPQLTEGSPKMEAALTALMSCSPVRVVEEQSMESIAFYNPATMTLYVNTDHAETEIFAALSTEIAYARIHDRGYNAAFDREQSRLDAESIGYLTCRRFGIACSQPDMASAMAAFNGLDAAQRGQTLERFRTMSKDLSYSLERAIQPPQQEHSRRDFSR